MNTNTLRFLTGLKLQDDLLIVMLAGIALLLAGVIVIVLRSVVVTRSVESILQKKFKAGDYAEVIRIAQDFTRSRFRRDKRDSLFVMYYLAQAYEAQGASTSALKFYQEANVIASAFNNRKLCHSILLHTGRLYEKMGKPKDALAQYLMLIEDEKNNAEALYSIALLQYKNKNVKKAREYLELSLKLRPGLLDARFLYGKLLYESGASSGALKQFHLLEHHDPENVEVYFYKARTLENLKKYHDAIREHRKLLNREWKNPGDPRLPDILEKSRIAVIQLHIKIKDYFTGIQAVSEFLSLPSSERSKTEMLYLYANLLWNTGDEYSALKNYERVHLMDKNFKDAGIMVERYKKILPHSYLSHYFTADEGAFETLCGKILARHHFELQYRHIDFFIFAKGVFTVVFFRHIEPIAFSKLTDIEILLNSFPIRPQNIELYSLSGVREDAVTHYLLRNSHLIEGDEFIKTVKKNSGKDGKG